MTRLISDYAYFEKTCFRHNMQTANLQIIRLGSLIRAFALDFIDQRTNGPVNAHLISWPTKAQNIQNLENIWYRNDLDLQYSHNFKNSISCLHLLTFSSFRSLTAIVSEKSTVFTFSYRKT